MNASNDLIVWSNNNQADVCLYTPLEDSKIITNQAPVTYCKPAKCYVDYQESESYLNHRVLSIRIFIIDEETEVSVSKPLQAQLMYLSHHLRTAYHPD